MTRVFQTRIHGRGGQGVVTAAELLSTAAFLEGLHAQAFPSFGSERMGAPVVSYTRMDRLPIRRHDPVHEADAIVVQDATLLHELDLFRGLNGEGYVVISSERSPLELGLAELVASLPKGHLMTCPAAEISRRHTGRPLPNAALLGALSGLTGCVRLESLGTAIRRRLPEPLGSTNEAAAGEAYSLACPGTTTEPSRDLERADA